MLVSILLTVQPAFGQSLHSPGWYSHSGPSIIYEDNTGLRIVWGNSYIYKYPGDVALYWYAQVIYLNVGSQTLDFPCLGEPGDPSTIKEHMRGTDNSGYVPAEESFCTRNPSFTTSIEPGGALYTWAIFHNVPSKGGEVSLELGPYGFSPWVDPWYRPYPHDVPPPAECPPELVTLGTCQEDSNRQPMKVHFSQTPEGKAPHLVVLVHGCCTTYDAYLREWYWDRGDAVISAIARKNAENKDRARAWEIVVFDWSNFTPVPPVWDINNFLSQANIAYDATSDKPGQPGKDTRLAEQIEKYPYYKYTHLIAHSAGANLIDTVAIKLLAKSIETGHKPFVHLTFLDAYTPKHDELSYGSLADFAEHYVDKTTGGLSLTDEDLTYAFNFDITHWEHPIDLNDLLNHQWPLRWYTRSIRPMGSNGTGNSVKRAQVAPRFLPLPAWHIPPNT